LPTREILFDDALALQTDGALQSCESNQRVCSHNQLEDLLLGIQKGRNKTTIKSGDRALAGANDFTYTT